MSLRCLVVLLLSLQFNAAQAFTIPEDSLVRIAIKESLQKKGISLSCLAPLADEPAKIEMNIAFKDTITLGKQVYVLVISVTKTGGLHGHVFGCVNYFFLKDVNNRWEVTAEIFYQESSPIGDDPSYQIVNIGKNRKALLSVFQSTGNSHFEKKTFVQEITLERLTPLLTVDSEYDNSAWRTSEEKGKECEAVRIIQEFEIVKSDQAWYDIMVKESRYGFQKDCETTFLIEATDIVYVYSEGEYVLK
ncbi:MAG: hypothetical protein RIB86_03315 [Imperialibacter sp.]